MENGAAAALLANAALGASGSEVARFVLISVRLPPTFLWDDSVTFTYRARGSNLPLVDTIWCTEDLSSGTYIAPADGCWDLIFVFGRQQALAIVSGPTSEPTSFDYQAGSHNVGIRFHPSTSIVHPDVPDIVGFAKQCEIDEHERFELFGEMWNAPTYEEAERLVEQLAAKRYVEQDPVVYAFLERSKVTATQRTIQRRFERVTGLPPTFHERVKQAHEAAEMLRRHVPLAEVAYAMGYADQAHMTRVLKKLAGLTPSQLAATSGPGSA